jgi:hypothetical protein
MLSNPRQVGQLGPSNVFAGWPWTETLATARPGSRYRLARIPFSISQSRCRELGCTEGATVTCTANGAGRVQFRADDGREAVLEREVAWFVHAEAVA